MLVIGLKPGESFVVGDQIRIRVVSVDGRRIRIGIEAPKDLPVLRDSIPAGAAVVARMEAEKRTRVA
jgi:carbon storage regulator